MICSLQILFIIEAFLENDNFRTGIKNYTTEFLTCIAENGRVDNNDNNEACSTGVVDRLLPRLILRPIIGNHPNGPFMSGHGRATSSHPRAWGYKWNKNDVYP